jgi:PAS domain-containing protein
LASSETPATVLPDTPAWVADIVPGLAKLANAACVISADEFFLYANPVFFIKTGKSPGTVIGRSLVEVNDDDSYEIVRLGILRAITTKSAVSFGRAWRTLENTVIWVDFRKTGALCRRHGRY